MRDPLVVLEGVSRTYRDADGTRTPLRDVWGEVVPGDRVALVGPSGSGKTTLLLLLAGLDAPTSGRVRWPALEQMHGLRPELVGMAFQGPSLLGPLTAAENVALPLLLLGREEREAMRRALEVLEALDLAQLADRLPEQLSAGQAQRVAVARALVSRPRLVLLDEPTGQLDHATAAPFLEAVCALVAPGSALVVATHDEVVAARMHRRWVLSDALRQVGA